MGAPGANCANAILRDLKRLPEPDRPS
jgi:hypothetical protein